MLGHHVKRVYRGPKQHAKRVAEQEEHQPKSKTGGRYFNRESKGAPPGRPAAATDTTPPLPQTGAIATGISMPPAWSPGLGDVVGVAAGRAPQTGQAGAAAGGSAGETKTGARGVEKLRELVTKMAAEMNQAPSEARPQQLSGAAIVAWLQRRLGAGPGLSGQQVAQQLLSEGWLRSQSVEAPSAFDASPTAFYALATPALPGPGDNTQTLMSLPVFADSQAASPRTMPRATLVAALEGGSASSHTRVHPEPPQEGEPQPDTIPAVPSRASVGPRVTWATKEACTLESMQGAAKTHRRKSLTDALCNVHGSGDVTFNYTWHTSLAKFVWQTLIMGPFSWLLQRKQRTHRRRSLLKMLLALNPQKWKWRCMVISPQHRLVKRWDTITMLLLIFTALVTPYEVALLDPHVGTLFYVNRVVDTCFFLDLCLSFFLAYFDKTKQRWEFAPERVALHYLSGWFTIDIVSILPIDVTGVLLHSEKLTRLQALRILRLFRLAKLLRILKTGRVLSRIETAIQVDYSSLQLSKFLLAALVFAHWMACAFCMLLRMQLEAPNWAMVYYNCTDTLCKSRDMMHVDLYLAGLYWSVMTMSTIGYGDLTATNQGELIFSIICMMGGAFAYGYIIGAVSGIISTRDAKQNYFYSTMDELNSFMDEARLPKPMCIKLREFFKYRCNNSIDVNSYHSLLQLMSPQLRGEVAVFTNASWINSVTFFHGCPQDFIIQVALAMQHQTFPPMEIIVTMGDHLAQIYIIKRGVVVARGRVLNSGKVLGEESLYKEGEATYNARSMTFSDVNTLSRDVLLELLDNYPDTKAQFRRLAIAKLMREEVLAYAEAYYNVQAELALQASDAADAQGQNGDALSAPQLDEDVEDVVAREITTFRSSRVLHYERKLRMWILVESKERHFAEVMALRIQRAWRRYRKNVILKRQQHAAVEQEALLAAGYPLGTRLPHPPLHGSAGMLPALPSSYAYSLEAAQQLSVWAVAPPAASLRSARIEEASGLPALATAGGPAAGASRGERRTNSLREPLRSSPVMDPRSRTVSSPPLFSEHYSLGRNFVTEYKSAQQYGAFRRDLLTESVAGPAAASGRASSRPGLTKAAQGTGCSPADEQGSRESSAGSARLSGPVIGTMLGSRGGSVNSSQRSLTGVLGMSPNSSQRQQLLPADGSGGWRPSEAGAAAILLPPYGEWAGLDAAHPGSAKALAADVAQLQDHLTYVSHQLARVSFMLSMQTASGPTPPGQLSSIAQHASRSTSAGSVRPEAAGPAQADPLKEPPPAEPSAAAGSRKSTDEAGSSLPHQQAAAAAGPDTRQPGAELRKPDSPHLAFTRSPSVDGRSRTPAEPLIEEELPPSPSKHRSQLLTRLAGST